MTPDDGALYFPVLKRVLDNNGRMTEHDRQRLRKLVRALVDLSGLPVPEEMKKLEREERRLAEARKRWSKRDAVGKFTRHEANR